MFVQETVKVITRLSTEHLVCVYESTACFTPIRTGYHMAQWKKEKKMLYHFNNTIVKISLCSTYVLYKECICLSTVTENVWNLVDAI